MKTSSIILHEKSNYCKAFNGLTLSVLFSIFCISGIIAQPVKARVKMSPVNSTTVSANCNIVMPDSGSFQSIEVNLYDLITKDTLFSHEFIYDQASGLPSGLTWSRDGVNVNLGLGNLPKKIALQGKVRLKSSGQWSNPYNFYFN